MAERRTIQTIDRAEGRGQLYLGTQPLASVNYELEVQREFIIARDFDGDSKGPGVKWINGIVIAPLGALTPGVFGQAALPKGLELALEDGRRLNILLGDPLSSIEDRYPVEANGGFY